MTQQRFSKASAEELSKTSKTWRGSLGDIQPWRRTLKVAGSGEDFKYSAPLLSEHSAGKQGKLLPSVQSSSHNLSALAQLSLLDRQRLIEDCEKEVTQIHSEFALLERADFVDFISSSYRESAKAPQIANQENGIAEKKNFNLAT